VPAEPPGSAACHVRGLATSIAACTTVPASASLRRSVPRLHPSRPSPRADRYPSRDPCPRAVSRTFSPRPHGGVRTRPASGSRSRRELVLPPSTEDGASMPSWASSLQRTPPPHPDSAWVRGASPRALARPGVPSSVRPRVLSDAEVGWPLSGLPALVGFSHLATVATPRGPCGRRAHGFTSRPRPLQAAPSDLCPLAKARPRIAPRPGVAVHR
jgi:hypothetical protein